MSRKLRAYAAPALEKGLDVIELLARERTPLSAGAIGERLGRSRGELFRMIAVLLARGYVTRDPATDDLTLSNRLFDLGMRATPVSELIELAVPAMRRLADLLSQSVYMGVPSRGEAVVVASVRGGLDVTLGLRLGYRRPLADATSGRVILAFQTAAELNRLIAECRPLLPADFDFPGLDQALDQIRERGYEVHASRDVAAVTDIGCPILDKAGHAVATLVVTYVNRLHEQQTWMAVVNALQAEITQLSPVSDAYAG